MRNIFVFYTFFLIFLFHPLSHAYIKFGETKMHEISVTDLRKRTSFSVLFPENGGTDQFINAVNRQRPTDPLVSERITLLIEGEPVKLEQLNKLAKFSAVLMATVENERWAPVKKQLIIKLKEASEYLTREIHKLFEQIPDEGRVDDLPTLDEQSWQIFLDSAKDVYNSVHQHDILSSEKYPLELFADILYYTIKQAACSENYLEEQLKRCLFPEEGVIDFGEDICRKFSTGAKKYREQLNSR